MSRFGILLLSFSPSVNFKTYLPVFFGGIFQTYAFACGRAPIVLKAHFSKYRRFGNVLNDESVIITNEIIKRMEDDKLYK